MKEFFYAIADWANSLLRGSEILLCSYRGEDSDFVRFNRSRIRQAGSVFQEYLLLELIDDGRRARGETVISGRAEADRPAVSRLLGELRDILPILPEDPHLLFATEDGSSEWRSENRLPDTQNVTEAVLEAAREKDLVGFYAAGGIHAGFANSFGQRNWFSTFRFGLDWSLYRSADKAAKGEYAGAEWEPAEFRHRMEKTARHLEVLARPPRRISPGEYRVYLAPAALWELLNLVSYGGFGLRACRTKKTPLLKMFEEGFFLSKSIHLAEESREGRSPDFQEQGFRRPPRIPLIEGGAFSEALVSPRSAREYGVATNGASEGEMPQFIEMTAGEVSASGVLSKLERGVYVNNLWYLNFSDIPACRITGLTRFATLWVEGGEIQAPLAVMRFDETLYRALGENLLGLTAERDLIADGGTYSSRSMRGSLLPGALVGGFRFTS